MSHVLQHVLPQVGNLGTKEPETRHYENRIIIGSERT